jgi:nitroreductase
MCYPNGKKTVTQAWLDRVGPMGLAYLWMDDGSVCEGHGRLHSEGFSLAENQLLASWFTKQGFHAAPHHAKNKYWYLAFTREGLRNLVGVIEPFVINLLKYKLEVLPALPTIPCACCGTLLQAHNNQASGVNAVCGNTDCLRWQNRMRNRTYLADPENLAFHNAQGRIRYHRDLEKSREANRAVAKRMRADPERRANYNRRRQQWRAMRRANGLSAP